MKRLVALGLLVGAACAFSSCGTLARQPEFRSATIVPPRLQPGQNAEIRAEVSDYFGIVDRIEAAVYGDATQESPLIRFDLRDDGSEGDTNADDNIWTLPVEVPFQAPPGSFHLKLTAYDADGRLILIRDEAGDATPLTAELDVVIEYPEG